MKRLISFACLLVLPSFTAFANDSMGDFAAGGLELKKTAAISIEKEELAVSVAAIEVNYDFKNHSKKEVTATVVFPIPLYQLGDGYYQGGPKRTFVSVPFDDFKVWVDDNPVDPQRTVQIFAVDDSESGKDYFPLLSKHISDPTMASSSERELKELDEQAQAKLDAAGLIDHTMADQPMPRWQVKVSYYWKQTFPAGKVIHARHTYTPAGGGTTMCTEGCLSDERYCVSEGGILDWVKKKNGQVSAQWVAYVLTTGANWDGPIKDFTLTLTKPDADTRISLCFDKIKTGPLTFVSHLKNFTPSRDLQVLFLKPDPG